MTARPGARGDERGARRLTAQERRLWQRAMAEVARGAGVPPDSGAAGDGPERAEPPARPARPPAAKRAPAAVEGAEARPAGALSMGGLDKRNAQRLRRGQYPIDAELDLHRHTQAQGERALRLFLERAQASGKRCALVITGKGKAEGEGGGWDAEGRIGVLREQVPRWLDEPRNRALVVAWHPARPKDGGVGALYVLLRRKRS